jgi:hypothetical protein
VWVVDAATMSFLAPRDGVMNVWVAPTGEFAKARALTADTHRGVRRHFWLRNGRHIAYLQDNGGNDPRVTRLESDQLTDVMLGNGQQVTYVNYGDEGHGFARPEDRDSFFAISEAFIAGCLGGRYQSLDGAFAGSSTEVLAGIEHVPGLAEVLEGFVPVLRR